MATIQFPASPSLNETVIRNSVAYTWNGSFWEANTVNSDFDDRYVEKSGDNMTGDLTLGTDRIELDATDGNITSQAAGTFGLPVQVGADPNDGVGVGTKITNTGLVQATRADGASAVFTGYAQGTTDPNIRINGDGSITAAGELLSQSAAFNYKQGKAGQVLGVYEGLSTDSAATFAVTTDGSAQFKGDVAVGDSSSTFRTIAAVIAALPEGIRTRFADALAAWETAGTLDLEDPTTLPADDELREAIIRATTAGKINLNGDDGSIRASSYVRAERLDDTGNCFSGNNSTGNTFSVLHNGDVTIANGNATLNSSGALIGHEGYLKLFHSTTETHPWLICSKSDGANSYTQPIVFNDNGNIKAGNPGASGEGVTVGGAQGYIDIYADTDLGSSKNFRLFDSNKNAVFTVGCNGSVTAEATITGTALPPNGTAVYGLGCTDDGTSSAFCGRNQSGTLTFDVRDDGSIITANTVVVGTSTSPLSNSNWGYQVNANANENGYALYLDSVHSSPDAPYFLRCYVNGSDTYEVRTDGTVKADGDISGSRVNVNKDGGFGELTINDTLGPAIGTGGTANRDVTINVGNGSADVLHTRFKSDGSIIVAGSATFTRTNATISDAFQLISGDVSDGSGGTENAFMLRTNGSAFFKGRVDASNVTFALEPENEDNYEVTTETYTETEYIEVPVVPSLGAGTADIDNGPVTGAIEEPQTQTVAREVEKTREIKTYVGPTLNVKDELIALRDRAATQDAVIAQLSARLATLES